MKRALQISIIVLLLAVVVIQILSFTGKLSAAEKQEVCPVNAITMKQGKAVIDSMKCIGCRRCVDGFVAIPAEEFYLSGGQTPIDPTVIEKTDDRSTPIDTQAAKTPVNPAKKSPDSSQQVLGNKLDQKALVIPTLEVTPAADSLKQASYYVVDAESCISCGMCLRVCPEKAISYVDGVAYIDPEKCTDCGICAGLDPKKFRGCPVGAIHPAKE